MTNENYFVNKIYFEMISVAIWRDNVNEERKLIQEN